MTALRLQGVSLVRDGREILRGIDWDVAAGDRWVVIGPNGSGKTSLVRIASLYLHPSSGSVEVLGRTLGRVDVREHRRRIGVVSAAMADLLRPSIEVLDAVVSARFAALETWWHQYDDDDRARAAHLLDQVGLAGFERRAFATLSSGERQRALLARALMGDPGLVLLDEPMAGLDLAAREQVVGSLAALAAIPATPPIVLVTHHVDEIPPGFTHALLLRDGAAIAQGPLEEVVTAGALGACFGVDVRLERIDERWFAWAAPQPSTTSSNRGFDLSISSPSIRSRTGPQSPPP